MALRNLVARTREYCDTILELGAEHLINNALTNHKICDDEAKAALRDLGCKVEIYLHVMVFVSDLRQVGGFL
jgi:hypothetical protein